MLVGGAGADAFIWTSTGETGAAVADGVQSSTK
jgi:hypothetical protein